MLVHRGLGDPHAARRFLHPSLDDLHDPAALRDLPQAIERLQQAIRGRERILIYGDYDVVPELEARPFFHLSRD